jgi:hypothetical protein
MLELLVAVAEFGIVVIDTTMILPVPSDEMPVVALCTV